MAKSFSRLRFTILLAIFFISINLAISKSESFAKITLSPSKYRLGKEKFTHIHLYYHEEHHGPNKTSVEVTRPLNNSSSGFGAITVMDSKLTVGPDLSSEEIGREQGIFFSSSQSEMSLTMAYNIVFTRGEYKGSSIAVLGQNPFVKKPLRELPIVGGTGRFRFARGYILTSTISFNMTSGISLFDYNLYILHYCSSGFVASI